MRLEEAAAFLRRHAVAFPVGPTDAALLAIALYSLAIVVEGNPDLRANLKAGVASFIDGAQGGAEP